MPDTIFAQATPAGKSGVAIIRISGDRAVSGCAELVGALPLPHRAALRRICDGDRHLDTGLVIHFPAGRSFTGEDVVELHLHGSVAVCRAVTASLGRLPGFRPAEAGEFTRRALENEALDLAQVEGLADLIDAETEAQRLQAQRVFDGELGRRISDWRRDLTEAAALIAATIDFADEEVPVDVASDVRERLGRVVGDLNRELASTGAAERIRNGFEIAITGAPNVGKSTLLNALARRPAALTSEIAGTTRDVIEVRMDFAGQAVTLIDTAGLRETSDPLEHAGIALARERAAAADLRLHLVGPGQSRAVPDGPTDLNVYTHADVVARPGMAISALSGTGIGSLIDAISARLADLAPQETLLIRDRHVGAFATARGRLEEATSLLDEGAADEIVAEAIGSASASLTSIIGRIDAEDLLEDIFSRFCIGK